MFDLIRTYSDMEYEFPEFHHVEDVMRIQSFDLMCRVDMQADMIDVRLVDSSPALQAWFEYFQYFELFQLALVLHNHYLHRENPLP